MDLKYFCYKCDWVYPDETSWNTHTLQCHGITRDTYPQPYITKDSGERQEFSTGMKRDIQTGKPRYDLLDRPMLKRWAGLMARGAEKYGDNNWRKAEQLWKKQ